MNWVVSASISCNYSSYHSQWLLVTNSHLNLNIFYVILWQLNFFEWLNWYWCWSCFKIRSKIFNEDPKDDQIQQVGRWLLVYKDTLWSHTCASSDFFAVQRNIHTGCIFNTLESSELQGIFTLGFTVEVFWNIQHIGFTIFVHQSCKEYSHWKHCALPLGLVLVKLKLWIWWVLQNIDH